MIFEILILLIRIHNAFWRFVAASDGVLSDCRLVILSLTMHAKHRVVVRRVVAISHCRSAQMED
jgi:hypothetical protein